MEEIHNSLKKDIQDRKEKGEIEITPKKDMEEKKGNWEIKDTRANIYVKNKIEMEETLEIVKEKIDENEYGIEGIEYMKRKDITDMRYMEKNIEEIEKNKTEKEKRICIWLSY